MISNTIKSYNQIIKNVAIQQRFTEMCDFRRQMMNKFYFFKINSVTTNMVEDANMFRHFPSYFPDTLQEHA